MKRPFLLGIYIVGLASLMLMGFQCSSKEMTSAKLYIQRKEYENALKQLQMEVQKNPVNEEAFYLMGQLYFEMKNYKEMKDAFVKALEIAPVHQKEISSQLLAVWGRMFNQGVEQINKAENNDDFAKAIESFQMASYMQPDSLINEQNIGLAYYRMNKYDEAIEPLTISFEKGKSLLSCRVLSSIYLLRADEARRRFNDVNQEALESLKNLQNITEGMKSADVRFYIGQPSSVDKPTSKGKSKSTDPEKWMFEKYNLVLTVSDGVVKDLKYTKTYRPAIDSSDHKVALQEFDKAIVVLRKGIEMFPEDVEISDNLMNAFIGAERNDEARKLLENRVKKYPDKPLDHYNLGVFLLRENNYENAINEFRVALSLDSTYGAAVYNLAASYVNWGVAEQDRLKKAGKEDDKSYQDKFKMAIPYLEQVLVEKPNEVMIWELLGQVYANLGDSDKAKNAYEKADAIRAGKK